jgi:hypothetical protein
MNYFVQNDEFWHTNLTNTLGMNFEILLFGFWGWWDLKCKHFIE